MKISMRVIIVVGVVIVMAGFIALGVVQTQKQAVTPPQVADEYSFDERGNQQASDLSTQPIMVAVDAEYESDVAPVTPESIPSQIVGVTLEEIVTGDQALSAINVLHGTEISILDGIVARYRQGEDSVDLWFSTSASVEEATELLTKMLEELRDNEVYSTPIPMPIRKRVYYQTISAEDISFFFQRGRQVVWVTLDVAQDQMMPAMQAVVGI